MTKFRSLLFREFRINSKTNKAACLIVIPLYLFLLVGTIILSSMNKGQPEFDVLLVGMNSIHLMFLIVPYIACMDDKGISSDINTGWLNYSYALPITASERACVMFAYSLLIQNICMLVGLFGVFSLKLITGETFIIGYLIFSLITLALTILRKSIVVFFTLKARNSDEYKKLANNGNLLNMGVTVCIFLLAFKISGLNFEEIAGKSGGPLTFDFVSMLTGDMLFWVVPIPIVLCTIYFGLFIIACNMSIRAE